MRILLYTDGGARGNPGPGAAGAVLKNERGDVIKKIGKFLGTCTNNEAEYLALLAGLDASLEEKGTDLICFLDSELIVRQLKGEYRVKSPKLRIFFDKVREMEGKFSRVEYQHVVRSKNKDADSIVNQVLDKRLLK